ncbi:MULTISPECIES: hypothetical protein [Providencia]|uniref:Uncharacterized protein n=1 Tax=Providencia rettgeri TaxID=587 RepID=A0AB35LEA8_PRORE|nr:MULTISPECIES: hypothetical protein [Providencia]MDH2306500.1 hypothetical protein [Providencia rettgeri]
MCNEKSVLERLEEVIKERRDLKERAIKENTANILNRSKYKSQLKKDVLSCLFLYMENYNLGIDAVYEVLLDIRTELNFEFNAKIYPDYCINEILYNDEIPF